MITISTSSSIPLRDRRGIRLAAALTAATAFLSSHRAAPAASLGWNAVASGSWSTGAWTLSNSSTPTPPPVAGDSAYVSFSTVGTYTLSYDGHYPAAAPLTSVSFRGRNGATLTVAQSTPGHDLTAANITIAGSLSAAATFAQSASTLTATSNLQLGTSANAATSTPAAYSLSGTGVLNTASAYIGDAYSPADFVQTGGTHTNSFVIRVGYGDGTTGSYSLSGDTTVFAERILHIGDHGIGSFTQTGGTHTSSSELNVGFDGPGYYSLSGASAILSIRTLYVGRYDPGTLTQSGGSAGATTLYIAGSIEGQRGTYVLSGGTLSTVRQRVGYAGNGSLVQTGGTNTTTYLAIAAMPSSVGTYSLSGTGALNVTGDMALGGYATADNSFPQTGGAGALMISGGTATVAGSLRVFPDGASRVSLTGGTLTVGGLLLSSQAAIDLSGGTLLIPHAGTPSAAADSFRDHVTNGRIVSFAAYDDPLQHLAVGYTDDGITVTARMTHLGDANLNGRIDPDDYALLDRSFAKSVSNPHWQDGDFNYDGQINSADYLLIDRVFAQQTGPLSPDFLAGREAQFGPEYVPALLASLPEPSLAAWLIAGLPLASRRRAR